MHESGGALIHPLFIPLLRRAGAALFTLLLTYGLIFSFLRILPGDPVELMLGEQALPAAREELREQLGLKEPWGKALMSSFFALLRGDLGTSFSRKEPVLPLILEHLQATALLAIASLIFSVCAGMALGILGGMKPGSFEDRLSRLGSAMAVSLPSFLIGPVLLWIFAVRFPLLPLGGYEGFTSLILPALTLSFPLGGSLSRILRNTLCDLHGEPFLVTARAKGAGGTRLLFFHMLRIAVYPLITVLGLQLGALLTGAVITEALFQWPGMGRLLVEAIYARDYPLIQGLVLVFISVYIGVNMIVDFLYLLLDPRTRRG